MRELRMLCLHGYHGSAAILRRQMAPLAATILPNVELVYVDAPSLSAGDFGWWHEGFSGWERTRDWAVELVRDTRIDGIFGFSQGAALTGLLAALRDSSPAPLSFEFAIMVGGFARPLVIEHDGGHVIPGDSAVTEPIAEFLAGFSRGAGAAPALDQSRASR